MLSQIRVRNMALIDEASVELKDKLNILTGETGAGKSILLGAVNLALGAKSAKDAVRDPSQPAFVELLFEDSSRKVAEWLEENGIEAEDGEILISRRFGAAGKGVSRINGVTVVSQQVKQLSSLLIDIHGQHEHQSLLNQQQHIDVLDRFAPGSAELKESLQEKLTERRATDRDLSESAQNEREKERLLSILRFESNEIDEANLQPGEEDKLRDERSRLMYAGRMKEDCLKAYSLLASSDGDVNAAGLVSDAIGNLSFLCRLDPAHFEARSVELNEALAVIEDAAKDFLDYGESVDMDEERLVEIDRRLDLIHYLQSKYGSNVEDILAYKESNDKKIEELLNIAEHIEALRTKLAKLDREIEALCGKLTALRRLTGSQIEQQITEILKTLQFSDPDFKVLIEAKEPGAKGADEVTFMIRTNVGEELKPLNRIASGGEISRVMLAIKTVLADRDEIGTLIFDEIDSGISGRTAQSVAEKMSMIAGFRQVIAVTHLPQIASMADYHFCIEKVEENGHSRTTVRELDETEQLDEIARLLGGLTLTETVRKNAEEMKMLANQWKKEHAPGAAQ